MPLPISISDLLTGSIVEGERLECKAGWNPEAVLHTICAFANDLHNWGGGYLLIGVAEKGGRPQLPPVGIPIGQIDTIQKELLKLCHRIQPTYYPVVEPVTIGDRHILVVWVPGGQNRPYKAPVSLAKEEKHFAYYVRAASSSVVAKGSIEQELLQLTAAVPFDDRINHRATLQDLQLRLIQAHLQSIGSELFEASSRLEFRQLCWQMRIVDGPDEAVHPRNVGLLFFNEQPERFLPTAWIDIVYLPDPTGADMREKRFSGPLDAQLRSALSYLREQFIEERVVKSPDRAEADRFFTYPYEAVEEALANAVYHRGYDVHEPIEVRITPTEITITSYPGPDPSIAMEALHAGIIVARRYRNRRIGEFLKELRLTEGRGTGVPRMRNAMTVNGSPLPRFETDQARSYFTVALAIHPGATQLIAERSPRDTQLSNRIEDLLRQRRIIDLLEYCRQPRTRGEIMEYLSLRDPKTVREQYVRPLLQAGLIAYTRPEAPTAKNQAYRTTAVGLQTITSLSR